MIGREFEENEVQTGASAFQPLRNDETGCTVPLLLRGQDDAATTMNDTGNIQEETDGNTQEVS
jgi:hypothetical protein